MQIRQEGSLGRRDPGRRGRRASSPAPRSEAATAAPDRAGSRSPRAAGFSVVALRERHRAAGQAHRVLRRSEAGHGHGAWNRAPPSRAPVRGIGGAVRRGGLPGRPPAAVTPRRRRCRDRHGGRRRGRRPGRGAGRARRKRALRRGTGGVPGAGASPGRVSACGTARARRPVTRRAGAADGPRGASAGRYPGRPRLQRGCPRSPWHAEHGWPPPLSLRPPRSPPAPRGPPGARPDAGTRCRGA